MKGLWVKDLRLMLVQKSNLIFMMVLCVGLMFLQEDAVFGACYAAILIGCLTIGTVNYDAFDNGMAFMMTLPIQRKTYVIEKYLFIMITGVISAFVMGGIGLLFIDKAITVESVANMFGAVWVAFIIVAVMAALMLPVQLKFGAERSRIVIALIAGMVFVGSAMLSRLGGDFTSLSLQLTENQMILIVALGIVAMLVVSMLISIRILEKKEY